MRYLCIAMLMFAVSKVQADDNDYVLAFWAPWCGPCLEMTTIEDQLISEGCDIRRVNIDEDVKTKNKYNIHKIPRFLHMSDGKECALIAGKCGIDRLREFCKPIKSDKRFKRRSVISGPIIGPIILIRDIIRAITTKPIRPRRK